MFSKKATKIDNIFTVDLVLCTMCQIDSEDYVLCVKLTEKIWSIFVAFLENMNFTKN